MFVDTFRAILVQMWLTYSLQNAAYLLMTSQLCGKSVHICFANSKAKTTRPETALLQTLYVNMVFG